MTVFLKTDKKGLGNFYLSSGTNKSIPNFPETIPLNECCTVHGVAMRCMHHR
jgi:hypothetical protein